MESYGYGTLERCFPFTANVERYGKLEHSLQFREEPYAIKNFIRPSNAFLRLQFVDISRQSSSSRPHQRTVPLYYGIQLGSLRATPQALRENAKPSSPVLKLFTGQTLMWLRNVQWLAQSKKGTFSPSATSMPYGESLDEELLRLGGLCMCRKDLQIASVAASTIIFAVANKVLYKMALVPLKEFPFFLALINTFGYVLVYFFILYMRYQAGIVTDEMLDLPKSHFILVGALEAIGLASGMAAAAHLPGTSISILLQTFLVWQLVLSMVFLKKRFSFGQIMASAMVLSGVAIALFGSIKGFGSSSKQAGLFWPSLMVLSCAFQASSTVVKEFVFRNASEHLKGGSVDLFVVNSFGSAFQAIFVLLMLPLLSQLRGIPFSQLSSYMTDGAGCVFNISSMSTECSGAMLLTLCYVTVNLAFNISLLSLLKMSSAVVSSLCSTLAVPLAIFMFTLPLPYVGATASLHPQFLVGTTILLCGLAFYNVCGCIKKDLLQIEKVERK